MQRFFMFFLHESAGQGFFAVDDGPAAEGDNDMEDFLFVLLIECIQFIQIRFGFGSENFIGQG